MKVNKVLYWVFTSLLCIQFLIAVGFYFFQTDTMKEEILLLGYPDYLVLLLGVLKLLAVISIFTGINTVLKEWSYAGLFFNLLFAIVAHVHQKDDDYWGAIFALIILILSYWFWIKNKRKHALIAIKMKRT